MFYICVYNFFVYITDPEPTAPPRTEPQRPPAAQKQEIPKRLKTYIGGGPTVHPTPLLERSSKYGNGER